MPRRPVARIPTDASVSGWYALLDPPAPARVLETSVSADWAIVGAGFAGLSAARRLSQLRPGERIVVLEAQRVGWGSAGRNSGFMIDLPHAISSETYAGAMERDRRQIAMNRSAIAFAHDAAAEYGLEAHMDRCGKLHGATNGHGIATLKRFERHLDALGEPFQTLDAADMKRITGSEYYAGGTHAPGATIIQPAAYIRGFADGISRTVELYESSGVVGIEPGATHTLHTPKGRVSASRIILTVNGHIESFGFFKRRLMHVFTYASMTRSLGPHELSRLGGEPSWALIPADPMGSTVRRLREGRIVVRNTFTYNPSMTTSTRQIDRIGRRHDRSFRARFPMLADVRMEYRWGGHICLSLNEAPAFGEVEERIYSACCENGLGTVRGTLSGKLAAELATGTRTPMLEDWLDEGGPRKIYPEPFMTAGAHARLWWMHRRAGGDL